MAAIVFIAGSLAGWLARDLAGDKDLRACSVMLDKYAEAVRRATLALDADTKALRAISKPDGIHIYPERPYDSGDRK